MKPFTFSFCALMLLAAGSVFAAPPQGAPAAGTAAAVPCPGMQGGMMGNGPGNCPGMQGRPMGPGMGQGMMRGQPMGPGMGQGMQGRGPGMGKGRGPRNAAPGAISKSGPAGSTNPTVYGWQLMTPAERDAYRAKMRAAKTARERAEIRAEHHKEMEARAKERGVTLPPGPATH